MVDLVLINPRMIGEESYPPISLLALASYVRKDFTVKIVDAQAEKFTDEQVLSIVKEETPIACGMTFMTNQVPFVKQLLDLLKKEVDTKFIAGGVHTSVLPHEVSQMGFDYCVVGEGELTLKEILKAIKTGKNKSIDGVWAKTGFKQRKQIDKLSILPMPAWDLVNIQKYTVSQPDLRYNYEGGVCLSISTSRGCPFECAFCSAHSVYGRGNRPRPVKDVVEEIKHLSQNYHINDFFIVDESIFGSKKRAEQFAEEILRHNLHIRYASSARVTDPGINLGTLLKMKESGLVRVDFGVESGSQRILDNIKKHTSIEVIKKSHNIAHLSGVKTTSLMIVGHLEEDWGDVYDTFEMIADMETDYPEFGPLTPFPATEVFEKSNKNGWIRDYDWGNYYISLPFRVMRSRYFDYQEIWVLHLLASSTVKVINKYKNTNKFDLKTCINLLRTDRNGLKPKGSFLVCKYMKNRDRQELTKLNLKMVKGSCKHNIYKNKTIIPPYQLHMQMFGIRKHPFKILHVKNKKQTILYLSSVAIQSMWQALPFDVCFYAILLYFNEKKEGLA